MPPDAADTSRRVADAVFLPLMLIAFITFLHVADYGFSFVSLTFCLICRFDFRRRLLFSNTPLSIDDADYAFQTLVFVIFHMPPPSLRHYAMPLVSSFSLPDTGFQFSPLICFRYELRMLLRAARQRR
jgi:hypothetical protein